MATPKTIEVPCWHRRFVSEEEMRSMLNLKKPQWKHFTQEHKQIVPNLYSKYDRYMVEEVFARLPGDRVNKKATY